MKQSSRITISTTRKGFKQTTASWLKSINPSNPKWLKWYSPCRGLEHTMLVCMMKGLKPVNIQFCKSIF